jgi:hypothetical protein
MRNELGDRDWVRVYINRKYNLHLALLKLTNHGGYEGATRSGENTQLYWKTTWKINEYTMAFIPTFLEISPYTNMQEPG